MTCNLYETIYFNFELSSYYSSSVKTRFFQPLKRPNHSFISRVATSSRWNTYEFRRHLTRVGLISFTFHWSPLWDIDFSVNQEFPWCKLLGGGRGRRVTHQELSGAVRGQDPDPWLGEARPASCHLSDTGWDRPSGWERPTMGGEELARFPDYMTAGIRSHTPADMFHVRIDTRTHVYARTMTYLHFSTHVRTYELVRCWLPGLFRVITSTICDAVHMNHSSTDRSGKQKWHAAIGLNRHK